MPALQGFMALSRQTDTTQADPQAGCRACWLVGERWGKKAGVPRMVGEGLHEKGTSELGPRHEGPAAQLCVIARAESQKHLCSCVPKSGKEVCGWSRGEEFKLSGTRRGQIAEGRSGDPL